MLSYTDLKPGTKFVLNNEPYIVLQYSFAKKQRQKPTVQTKIKNLITSSIIERSFNQSDKIEEAALDMEEIKFLYLKGSEYWFCKPNNPADRFKLDEDVVGSGGQFLKGSSIIKAVLFEEKIIAVEIPIKVDLKIVESPPAVRGNTAQGVTKQATLETGAVLNVPVFIKEGDVVRINTEIGEYVERMEKA